MLPTCPACGQSVLDDDAAECPFCGASMSGKPGKPKPAPAAKEAPAAPAAPRPAPAAPAAESGTSASKEDADGLFESAPSQTKTAIQAARKPMKGRMLRVLCPMCDTPGFVPKKAAGKDVRCANKKCMVPVFQAPAPKKAAAPEPEAESGGNSTMAIVAGIVGLLAVGGVLWAILGGDKEEKSDEPIVQQQPKDNTKKNIEKMLNRGKKDNTQPVDSGPLSLAELRADVLQKLDKAADSNTRDKPFCRRMSSEALVAADQLDRIADETRLIARRGDPQYYYRVFPYAALAWKQLAAGNQAKAGEAIDEALASMGRVPQFGQTAFDVTTSIAAVMIAAGRTDAAAKLVSDLAAARDFDDQLNHQAATASALATTTVAFEEAGSKPLGGPPVGAWSNPPWTATGVVLCAHGRSDEAIAWAGRAPEKRTVADTLAAIAAWAAATGQTEIRDKACSAAESAGPVVAVRAHAAAAFGASTADKQDAAKESLAAAESGAAKLPAPVPVVIRNLKELYEYEASDPDPAVLAALAMAELARAQSETGNVDAGSQTLLVAIRHAHSFCPAPAYITDRAASADSNKAQMLASLESALNISADQAQQALYRLSAKLSKALPAVAQTRKRVQEAFLAQLAESKLGDSVWRLVSPATLKDSILAAEQLDQTSLPWRVANGFWRSNRPTEAQAITDAVGQSAYPAVSSELACHRAGASAAQVAAELSPARDTNVQRLAAILYFADRFAAEDLHESVSFARSLRNPAWQRLVLQLVGSRAARSGQAHKLAKILEETELEPPARTAIYRGFVSGVRLDPDFAAKTPDE